MHFKTTLMVGAAVAALAAGSTLAAPPAAQAVPVAASYAELLEPIPNAVELLKASEAEAAMRPARLIPAQWDDHHHHNYHHHHHDHHDSGWYRNNGYSWNGGGWRLGPPAYRHHHNQHRRGWYQQNGYVWDGGAWVIPYRHHHHHHHNSY